MGMIYALDPLIVGTIKLLETDNSIEYPSGNQLVVYTQVDNDSDFPCIIIEPSAFVENDVTRNSIGQSHVLNIEVISKFKQGQGGWGANNNIVSQILPLIRDNGLYMDLSADSLIVKNQTIQSIQPLKESYKDGVYYRSIIVVEFEIEENP